MNKCLHETRLRQLVENILHVKLIQEPTCSRHVQINNDSAIKFYEKFGFEIVERKTSYYKRIEPADAFVLQKTFRPKTATDLNSDEPQSVEVPAENLNSEEPKC